MITALIFVFFFSFFIVLLNIIFYRYAEPNGIRFCVFEFQTERTVCRVLQGVRRRFSDLLAFSLESLIKTAHLLQYKLKDSVDVTIQFRGSPCIERVEWLQRAAFEWGFDWNLQDISDAPEGTSTVVTFPTFVEAFKFAFMNDSKYNYWIFVTFICGVLVLYINWNQSLNREISGFLMFIGVILIFSFSINFILCYYIPDFITSELK